MQLRIMLVDTTDNSHYRVITDQTVGVGAAGVIRFNEINLPATDSHIATRQYAIEVHLIDNPKPAHWALDSDEAHELGQLPELSEEYEFWLNFGSLIGLAATARTSPDIKLGVAELVQSYVKKWLPSNSSQD